jgi:hypothetical protein
MTTVAVRSEPRGWADDSGDRYGDTYYDEDWLAAHDPHPNEHAEALLRFEQSCSWTTLKSASMP